MCVCSNTFYFNVKNIIIIIIIIIIYTLDGIYCNLSCECVST